jgi:hypothetical protein
MSIQHPRRVRLAEAGAMILAVALQPVRMEHINSASGFIRLHQSYLSSSLYKILNKSGPFLCPNTAAPP